MFMFGYLDPTISSYNCEIFGDNKKKYPYMKHDIEKYNSHNRVLVSSGGFVL